MTAKHNLTSFGILCMKTGFVTLVFACLANQTLLTPPSSHVNHLIHDRISFRSFCDHKAHPRETGKGLELWRFYLEVAQSTLRGVM